ncbi:ATP-binding protein [Streptomyces sp. NPDC052000]|uniref:ATP-binding protein n=1 Tax=Streptomyces sp. NPDC052000 TaxID=3155676 RepID=UPI00344DD82F
MTSVLYPDLPENGLIVLIGTSGAGKSTLARTWPASQVLSPDGLRGTVSDDPGDQEATGDAADVLKLILERRMARHLNTVIDATNLDQPVRAELVTAAKRHGMPTAAVVVATPLELCLQRQGPRPDNRRVPEDVVRAQHQAMVRTHQGLAAEGFTTVVFADTLDRLGPFLGRLSQVREADLGRDGNEGLGDLLLVRRFFGPEILPLWRWRPDSDLVTGRDRVAELRVGRQSLTLAFRDDVAPRLGGVPQPAAPPSTAHMAARVDRPEIIAHACSLGAWTVLVAGHATTGHAYNDTRALPINRIGRALVNRRGTRSRITPGFLRHRHTELLVVQSCS